MKYRLGMLVAAFALTVSSAFAQANLGENTMKVVRAPSGITQARDAWLRADAAACNAWEVWANPFGMWNNQSNQGQRDGYWADVYGIQVGGDYNFGQNLKVGAGLSFADSDFNGRREEWDADQFTFLGTLFGVYQLDKFFFEGVSSYIYNKNDFNTRGIADQDAYGWNGKLTVGYEFALGCDFFLTPTLGIDYIWLKNKSFNYNPFNAVPGGGFNEWRSTSLQMPLLLTVAKSFSTNFGSLTPFIKGGWIHEFHDGATTVSANRTVRAHPAYNAADFNLVSPGRAHDLGQIGLGVNANVNGRADIFAAWDYQWANRYYSNTLNLGAGINF